MYETNKPKVPLEGEVDFMRNYIELMKLRCNEMTEVSETMKVEDKKAEVAPLLFISLIENAFKHGTNSNAPATIDISLTQKDSMLVFICNNTNNKAAAGTFINENISDIRLESIMKRNSLRLKRSDLLS